MNQWQGSISQIYVNRWKKTSWVLKLRSGAQSNSTSNSNRKRRSFQFCKGLEPPRPMQLLRAPSLLPLPCCLRGSAAALPAGGQIREKKEGCLAGRDGVLPPLWLPSHIHIHTQQRCHTTHGLRVSWGIPVTVFNRMRTLERMVGKHWDLYGFS